MVEDWGPRAGGIPSVDPDPGIALTQGPDRLRTRWRTVDTASSSTPTSFSRDGLREPSAASSAFRVTILGWMVETNVPVSFMISAVTDSLHFDTGLAPFRPIRAASSAPASFRYLWKLARSFSRVGFEVSPGGESGSGAGLASAAPALVAPDRESRTRESHQDQDGLHTSPQTPQCPLLFRYRKPRDPRISSATRETPCGGVQGGPPAKSRGLPSNCR